MLPVLPTREVLRAREPRAPSQPCGVCANQAVCWKTPKDAQISVAVCRLQMGIDRDQTAARLIEAAWPMLIRAARFGFGHVGERVHSNLGGPGVHLRSRKGSKVEVETLARDLAYALIQAVPKYTFGVRIPPARWLITAHNSAVWLAMMQSRDARIAESKWYGMRFSEDLHYKEVLGVSEDLEEEELVATLRAEAASAVAAVVHDGRTLSTDEFRVLTYCAGRPRVRPELARRMGLNRQAITRLFHLAVARVLCALGRTEAYFRQRGVELPSWANERRVLWAARAPKSTVLSPAQRVDVREVLRRRALTEAEVAWAFGIGATLIDTLRFQARHGA